MVPTTDTNPVISRMRSGSRDVLIQSQVGKLAECDENLSLIASDLASMRDELTQFRAKAEELARVQTEREHALAEANLRLEEERALALQRDQPVSIVESTASEPASAASATENSTAGHVRFIAYATGYGLSESDEPCPAPGELVEVDGGHYLVVRSASSPLPSDERRCAFLVPSRT